MMSTIRQLRNEFFKGPIDPQIIDTFLRGKLNFNNTQLLLNFQSELSSDQEDDLVRDFKRVEAGEPVQYVLGFAEFYGRFFYVDRNVLIPEVETNDLIDHVKDAVLVPLSDDFSILDVGTGSGNIAISLALELDCKKVLATDISDKALKVAKSNAKKLQADQVSFLHSDLLDDINGKFDLIVSNPPYVRNDSSDLEKSVAEYEPDLALYGGSDGLDIYRRLIPQIAEHLKNDGYAILEMDYRQGKDISKLVKNVFPSSEIQIFKDADGLDRFIAWRN
ncbi:peptide chain release factor N(5)-glutamine methyltransferase [Oenococcus alcoholitolerans]|uniref:peptide chain release factor N(5)-glutamine methyltransferase n=1 Tax=Oenococcus alcoholitolerans TaxID=931074 RepID=UPI003F6FD905